MEVGYLAVYKLRGAILPGSQGHQHMQCGVSTDGVTRGNVSDYLLTCFGEPGHGTSLHLRHAVPAADTDRSRSRRDQAIRHGVSRSESSLSRSRSTPPELTVAFEKHYGHQLRRYYESTEPEHPDLFDGMEDESLPF
jgi:hypothetical protein